MRIITFQTGFVPEEEDDKGNYPYCLTDCPEYTPDPIQFKKLKEREQEKEELKLIIAVHKAGPH